MLNLVSPMRPLGTLLAQLKFVQLFVDDFILFCTIFFSLSRHRMQIEYNFTMLNTTYNTYNN